MTCTYIQCVVVKIVFLQVTPFFFLKLKLQCSKETLQCILRVYFGATYSPQSPVYQHRMGERERV